MLGNPLADAVHALVPEIGYIFQILLDLLHVVRNGVTQCCTEARKNIKCFQKCKYSSSKIKSLQV